MITLRKSRERLRVRDRSGQIAWLSFRDAAAPNEMESGFGDLLQVSEQQLAPGSSLTSSAASGTQLMTHIAEGTLTCKQPGDEAVWLRAGDVQLQTSGRRLQLQLLNRTRHPAHILQLWLRSARAPPAPSVAQGRFPVAERRGRLRIIASPDGRTGSLRCGANALIFSSVLENGQHLVHALEPRRSVWLQVVRGRVTLAELRLDAGDAVGVSWESAVSFTADGPAEILLIELGELPVPSA